MPTRVPLKSHNSRRIKVSEARKDGEAVKIEQDHLLGTFIGPGYRMARHSYRGADDIKMGEDEA